MRRAALAALIASLAVGVSASNLKPVEGLPDYMWKQQGPGLVELEVYDLTDDPLWAFYVQEAVQEWNRPPFQLTYVRPETPPSDYRGKITVSDDDGTQYCGLTYIFRTRQGDVEQASIAICTSAGFLGTELHDQPWYMRRAIRHEMGNALTVGEDSVHNNGFIDFGCVMGGQDGLNVTGFDFGLLCQRYRCR